MMVRLRAWGERARSNLFFVPALFIIASIGLSIVTVWVDRSYQDVLARLPFVLETTVASSRALLGTVAAATITVAGIVFSVSVVAVQLTSSQFSPRALRGYMRDRFRQYVIGLVIGTFTYSLVVLAVTRTGGTPERAIENLSVTVALSLAVLSVLAIVAFIDRGTRSMQVSEIIGEIADETLGLVERQARRQAPTRGHPDLPADVPVSVPATGRGWVQQIDDDVLLAVLPPGAVARLDVGIGGYVAEGEPLLSAWGAGADLPVGRVNEAFALGRNRTMQQDVAFGVAQLVDIALRALSPGINDPTTANQALVELGTIVRRIADAPSRLRIIEGEDGRWLFRPHDPGTDDFVRAAFSQIRQAASAQPAVIETLIWQLGRVDQAEGGVARSVLRAEARLALAGLEASGAHADDVEPVVRLAAHLRLVDDDDLPPVGSGPAGDSGGAVAGPDPRAARRASDATEAR